MATATARDSHQMAALIGFGATAVYPYLGYAVLGDLCRSGELELAPDQAVKNYRKGIKKGLLKILSKMGIATIASYRGAQLFEVDRPGFRGGASSASPARQPHRGRRLSPTSRPTSRRWPARPSARQQADPPRRPAQVHAR